jgi:outer membrane protein assembly factor BamD
MSISFKTILSVIIIAALLSSCANRKTNRTDELANEQVEELYQRAKRALDNGNYFFALDYYRALEANFPYGQVTEQAKLDMIYALDKTNQVEEAIEAADNFIQLYPTHANVDYAYYMKGVASFQKKANRIDAYIKGGTNQVRDPKPLRDAEKAFLELIQRYPNSKYAEDAQQRIVFLRNRLAERELEVAKHYYKSRTYVATVNRCKYIIYQYETSPAVEGALLLMEQAYLEMGLQKLAASTRAVLEVNFPEHKTDKNSKNTRNKGFFSRLLGSKNDAKTDFVLPQYRGENRVSASKATEKPSLFKRLFGWIGREESPSLD